MQKATCMIFMRQQYEAPVRPPLSAAQVDAKPASTHTTQTQAAISMSFRIQTLAWLDFNPLHYFIYTKDKFTDSDLLSASSSDPCEAISSWRTSIQRSWKRSRHNLKMVWDLRFNNTWTWNTKIDSDFQWRWHPSSLSSSCSMQTTVLATHPGPVNCNVIL